MKILFLTFLAFTCLANTGCSKYLCKQSGQIFTANTCVAYISGNYYVSSCKQGSCTPTLGANNSTCTLEAVQLSQSDPGSKCQNSTDCSSGFCHNGVCKGQEKGQFCNSNYDCDPQLYCNSNNQCTDLIKPGKSGCTNDYSCVNNAGCNLNTCVEYFSLRPGAFVSNCPANNQNLLCSTGTCAKFKGKSMCTEGLKNELEFPYQCSVGSVCNSQADPRTGVQIQSECVCGLSKSGKAFCGLFSGDEGGLKFLGAVKKWMKSSQVFKCNTMDRLDESCIGGWWGKSDFAEFLYYYLVFEYYPYVAEAENCVLEVYLEEFYKAAVGFEGESSFLQWIGPLGVLVALAF